MLNQPPTLASSLDREILVEDTTWKVILKALLRKAFKITHFSILARRNGG